MDRINQVDLLGTAQVIEAFYPVVTRGTTMVVVASVYGHGRQGDLTSEFEEHLATAPMDQLLQRPELNSSTYGPDGAHKACKYRHREYAIWKGEILFVFRQRQRHGPTKGHASIRQARTAMSRQELEGLGEAYLQGFIEASLAKRAGGPFDVANAVAFLSSPEADFIIGSDIRVDGGWIVHENGRTILFSQSDIISLFSSGQNDRCVGDSCQQLSAN
ncbi:gluconate 5-dehydrogenase [Penicillium argentinense]|uniref:Gluconate 5-dehydrogenase n=1 Tax=Penicillium argentinense TaxID=1131581 RepID=A0A9W9EZS4_9EURO|nr:gluconate 5-dehydrogenase [Penicillium argentinense]KAJ5090950.1 gluconate 5-dehydrogenase [Penicillium argentinense]